MIRWVAAIIGYSLFRFPGAIAGYVLAGLFENMRGKKGGGRSFQDVFQQNTRERVTPADFELHLLSLATLVIKADGKVSQSELDFVRQYFVQSYGKDRANATFKVFNEVMKKKEISASRICELLRSRTRYESRLQILHFLFSISNADGHVSEAETDEINRISGFLGVQFRDFESIKAMFFKNPYSAYKILEIDNNASDAEVKKAYRTMEKKYHPDKLHKMDEAYQHLVEQEFKKCHDAE